MPENDLNIFASTNFRNEMVRFGIKTDDRRRHVYVIGKTGSGKTNMMEVMAINDIRSGRGVAVVDPHGEFAERMLSFIPEERIDDAIYFNPADMDFPIAFNPMEQVSNEFRHLIASGLMGVFKKIWVDMWSARMEYILNNTLLALLESPGATILGVMRMMAEKEYRKKIVENLKDPVIKAFWVNEFGRYSERYETEALGAIQNKIGQFVSNPLIRNVVGQPHSSLNMRKIMDGNKIFIANLSKGRIGEDNSALLGAMLITRLQLAAMSRVDIPEPERKDLYLYVDEFQNFATESFANILSEARKYHLNLILGHQYIEQLDEKVRAAVFGNVGTISAFRIGAPDAEFLEKEFMPEFTATDLVNLPKWNIYIKLMIDGIASHPFSAAPLSPEPIPQPNYADVIIENTRNKYATPRVKVEETIASEWLGASGTIVEEKRARQGERSLERTLRPDAQPMKHSPYYKMENRGSGGYQGRSPVSGGYVPGVERRFYGPNPTQGAGFTPDSSRRAETGPYSHGGSHSAPVGQHTVQSPKTTTSTTSGIETGNDGTSPTNTPLHYDPVHSNQNKVEHNRRPQDRDLKQDELKKSNMDDLRKILGEKLAAQKPPPSKLREGPPLPPSE
ncbi:MAG: type IV secretion system DNA-binding domain-containing protein [bacterium]|nr:type IV secretion system DNA-binding domain-containing protein [bacterium]